MYIKKTEKGPLAQRLEQRTHNPLVPGSNPGWPIFSFGGVAHLARAFEWHSKGSRFKSDHLQKEAVRKNCFFLYKIQKM